MNLRIAGLTMATLLGLVLGTGCGETESPATPPRPAAPAAQAKPAAKPAAKPVAKKPLKADDLVERPRLAGSRPRPNYGQPSTTTESIAASRRARDNSSDTGYTAASSGGHDEAWAIDRIFSEIAASTKVRKTLVVWLVDQTGSSGQLRGAVAGRLPDAFASLAKEGKAGEGAEAPLTMAVVQFGKEVTIATPEPVTDTVAISTSIAGSSQDGAEASVFGATAQAAEKFGPYRAQEKRDVMFVVLSQDGGDDLFAIDDAVAAVKKFQIPVYAIAKSLPAGGDASEGILNRVTAAGDKRKVGVGLYPERVKLAMLSGDNDDSLGDSYFGPFGVSRLAKETGMFGGAILLLQDSYNDADAKVMKKYAPEYVSEKQYQTLIEGNKARKGLHEAARMSAVENFRPGATKFLVSDPARLNVMLSGIQRASAILEPQVLKYFEVLAPGEADSKNLPPRLKLAYEIALARAMAAKVRVQGYNAMLAAIKQSKPFANPNSTTWTLNASETSQAGSIFENLAKKSRKLYETIAADHAGTPWAMIAQKELTDEAKPGFTFSES